MKKNKVINNKITPYIRVGIAGFGVVGTLRKKILEYKLLFEEKELVER